MKYLALCMFVILAFASAPVYALSCASVEGAEDRVPQNQLIVKAKIIDIKTAMHIPFIQNAQEQDEIITFEIIDLYKGPPDMPRTFDARFSPFYKTWGPKLKVGQEGEYLFDQKNGRAWQFSGPGGCNWVSEKAWQILRESAASETQGPKAE